MELGKIEYRKLVPIYSMFLYSTYHSRKLVEKWNLDRCERRNPFSFAFQSNTVQRQRGTDRYNIIYIYIYIIYIYIYIQPRPWRISNLFRRSALSYVIMAKGRRKMEYSTGAGKMFSGAASVSE